MKYLKYLLDALIMAAIAAMFAAILIEWSVGCGETYTDAAGVRHQNTCVFIPQPNLTKE